MMVFCYRSTNVHRRKQGKYIGLNSGYKQFNNIDKGNHDRGQDSNGVGFKNEYQSNKGKDHNVPGCDCYK